ncbi:hypothetical protein [Marinospirillum perlucidum]|uniref:hypothetical protein n=1 Tax=Marinospirillum perlucidum TaxID=1982602 RepID=UPI000DF3C1BC|nr:hypothetical protein [Marinospirillum perlucidum]
MLKSVVSSLAGVALLASLAVQAQEPLGDPFMGVGGSLGHLDLEPLDSSQASGIGVRLGVVYPDHRLHAQLNFHTWDEAETRVMAAHYDRLWSLTSGLELFAGVRGALVDLDLAAKHQTEEYVTGPGLGLQSGLIWEFSRGWSLETGLRFTRFQVEIDSQLAGKTELQALNEGYVSLNYRFY